MKRKYYAKHNKKKSVGVAGLQPTLYLHDESKLEIGTIRSTKRNPLIEWWFFLY